MEPTVLLTLAEMIQLAITPAFLLTGVGVMLIVVTGRLGRIIDRARVLDTASRTAELTPGEYRELRLIPRRVKLANHALVHFIGSAVSTCLLIALLLLLSLAQWWISVAVALVFIVSIALLAAGLLALLMEVRLALKLFYVDAHLMALSEPYAPDRGFSSLE